MNETNKIAGIYVRVSTEEQSIQLIMKMLLSHLYLNKNGKIANIKN